MSTGFPSASDDWPLTTPTTGSTGCYASAASGYATAAPFRRPRKPSRLMPAPGSGQGIVSSQTRPLEGPGSGCWDRPVGAAADVHIMPLCCDSRLLRHPHWRLSQLEKTVVSEPIQLELPLRLLGGEGIFHAKNTNIKTHRVRMPARIAK